VQSAVDGAPAHLTQRRQTLTRDRSAGAFGPLSTGAAVAALVASAALVLAELLVRPRRVVVEGRSMEPTLAPGDRLLVTRARGLHAGDVVAVRDPRDRRRVLVKRVGAVLDDEIVLRGDNPSASTDSRTFGPVPAKAVLGRVSRCYSPAWRAGPVR
jgi:inner membrane protease subunit 1